MQAVQAYQGSDLLLDWLGIFICAPAIQATLCLAPEVSIMIHNMLITIRKAKGDKGKDMLKGSSLPLPRLEPWANTLKAMLSARATKGSPSIPQIVLRNADKTKDSINIRGQRGDSRDLKIVELFLTCPKCAAVKDVARCTLYGTHAKVLSCTACKTSSNRWLCSHSICWLHCPSHREAGFICAGSERPRHSIISFFHKESKSKARIKRLGNLGQQK